MVSFRVSPEEYRQFQEICAAHGVRSISDLARAAMDEMVASGTPPTPLSREVRELRGRVRTLSLELERLTEAVNAHKTTGA
jgi:hypothetical protein